jgi:hypothetical protein
MSECIYEHSWVKAITCDKWARRRCTFCNLIQVSELNWAEDEIKLNEI